jgi:hypothetical protein
MGALAFRRQFRAVEIRTVAGPSRHAQWVLSGGPYTVVSHWRHVHLVCPPPWPEAGLVTDEHRAGGEAVTVRVSRRWVGIHFPLVVCTSSPSTLKSLCAGAVAGNRTGSRVLVALTWARQRIPLTQFTA